MKSKSSKTLPLRWYDPILLLIIPPIVALLIKLWMLSCRVVHIQGYEKAAKALSKSGNKAIFTCWHQRMSYHFHHGRRHRLTMMISQSRDGEYASRVAKFLGFKNVRGSSTRGGSIALRQMTQMVKEGERAGMLADGPLGPARVAKMGSVIMAWETEAPIIPLVWGVDRCWVLNSWDRYILPKPFSRVVVNYPEPFWVPPSTKKEDFEDYRRILEDRLNQATRWCDEYFGSERPWRKVKPEGVPEIGPL